MRNISIVFVVCIAAVVANPITITNNKIGDIVNINVKANGVVSSSIDQNILSGILGLINQQAAIVGGQGLSDTPLAEDEAPRLVSPDEIGALPKLPIAIPQVLIEKLKEKLNVRS